MFWFMCCPINFNKTLSIIFSLITASIRVYLIWLKNNDEKMRVNR